MLKGEALSWFIKRSVDLTNKKSPLQTSPSTERLCRHRGFVILNEVKNLQWTLHCPSSRGTSPKGGEGHRNTSLTFSMTTRTDNKRAVGENPVAFFNALKMQSKTSKSKL